MALLRESAWKYRTSSSLGAGYGIYAGESGQLVLLNPSGEEERIDYKAGGLGPGIGLRLPSKLQQTLSRFLQREFSGGISPEAFQSSGTIYATQWCVASDLDRADFDGALIYGELNLAIGKSTSADLFLMGMNLSAVVGSLKRLAGGDTGHLGLEAVAPKAVVISKGTGLGAGLAADLFFGWGS